MEATENLEIRTKMAEMHDSVLKRIETAYSKKQYIEVCWLCYACFESRVNRMLGKICVGCSKDERAKDRHIGITTKLKCLARLIKSKYPPLEKENIDWIQAIKGWCTERNELIHGLLNVNEYNDADNKFKNLAKRGKTHVTHMYEIAKDVREFYYNAESIPEFDESVIKQCRLEYRCL